jgi:hypothetical protein
MGNHEDLVAATAEEIVAAIAADAERLSVFRRRFVRALHDVGWLDIVGAGWARIGEDGLEFASLSFKKADGLLRALEDLALDVRPSGAIPQCTGQLEAF